MQMRLKKEKINNCHRGVGSVGDGHRRPNVNVMRNNMAGASTLGAVVSTSLKPSCQFQPIDGNWLKPTIWLEINFSR